VESAQLKMLVMFCIGHFTFFIEWISPSHFFYLAISLSALEQCVHENMYAKEMEFLV